MNAPIGMLDSGSGGLSIWREITSLLPLESTIYIGDHLHMPYSRKTTSYIHGRILRLMQFLIQKKVKTIVVACNTATVAGIDLYRKKFPSIPIVGVVPVVKTAAERTHTKHFAVLSTKYTSESEYQKNLIARFAHDCMVESVGSTRLVSLIETGDVSDSKIREELAKLWSKIDAHDVDVLVLGCTHYPFVTDQIRAIVGHSIEILDSGGAVARQVKHILERESMLSRSDQPMYEFYTTGDTKNVSRVASKLLDKKVTIRRANV